MGICGCLWVFVDVYGYLLVVVLVKIFFLSFAT